MILCTSCKHDDNCTEVRLAQMWGLCEYYSPRTNADRIRAMSDEELAEWIVSHDNKCKECGTLSKDGYIDWLRQPAEGGGEDA